jgi:hypothetical protein
MDLLIHFFVAMFFINALPHFINGLSGRPFPSPFASPPGKGESPALLNIVWACINFAIAGLLISQCQDSFAINQEKLTGLISGAILTAIMLSWWFGKIYGCKNTT